MSSSAPDVDLKSRGLPSSVLTLGVVILCSALPVLLNRSANTGDEVGDGVQEASLGTIIIGWLLWLAWRLLQLVAFVFLMLLVVLVVKQRSILYVPVPPGTQRSPKDNPHTFRSPEAWQLPFEDVSIITEDGTKINAWFVYQDTKGGSDDDIPYTMLYFHGNAGNIGHRLENIRDMHRHLGVNVLILDYRGYGDSEDGPGPTEAGFSQDAMASFTWLLERARNPSVGRIRADRIIFFGRSIGGAVAVKLAAELLRQRRDKALFGSEPEKKDATELPLPVGLVLENTFTSLRDMAVQLFAFLKPLRFLLRSPLIFDEWNSVDSLTYLASNHEHWCCCLFSGLQDQIVPPEQMKQIHTLLKGHRPKVLKCFQFPHGGHNDTPQRGGKDYWVSFNKYMDLVRETEPERLAALKLGS